MAVFELLEGGLYLAGLGALCVHVACSSPVDGRKEEILHIYTSTALLAGVLTLLGQYLVMLSQNSVITGVPRAAMVRATLSSPDLELIVCCSAFGASRSLMYGFGLQWLTLTPWSQEPYLPPQ
jgi:hypothetical protein